MSKKKLAVLVFALAFGVNIFAFVFSKKAYVIEEVKNVWLYELPLTASPLDAYVAVDFGPHNGIIGTLGHLKQDFDWKAVTGKEPARLTLNLVPGITYSNKEAILPAHWQKTREWALPYLEQWKTDPLWNAYVTAQVEWTSPTQVQFSWKATPANFDADAFVQKVLSHPMTGVIHPSNLGKKLTKEVISSGPYKVMKWRAKEITIVSRDDFPVTIQKEFFRTLKFQSAPVKNPSCDFMQAKPGEEKGLDDHRVNPVNQTLHVFWACRSWKQPGSFCSNAENRANFAKLISGTEPRSSLTLSSQKVRYRIPFGSDAFRNEFTEKLKRDVMMMGGTVEEISYFFKPSTDADIELLFVVADTNTSRETTEKMALFSSRLNKDLSEAAPHLVGEFTSYPIQVLMKNMKGEAFSKVFLEPDLEEKKIPL